MRTSKHVRLVTKIILLLLSWFVGFYGFYSLLIYAIHMSFFGFWGQFLSARGLSAAILATLPSLVFARILRIGHRSAMHDYEGIVALVADDPDVHEVLKDKARNGNEESKWLLRRLKDSPAIFDRELLKD